MEEEEEYDPQEEYLAQYYILENMKPIACTFPEYVDFCEKELHVIEETWITVSIRVLTIFTGTDQSDPPLENYPLLLFETMVTGTNLPIAETYTSNLGDAKAFHYERVFELRKLYKQEENNA